MKKQSRRSLSLHRTTLRSLGGAEMSQVDGGTVFTSGVVVVTHDCPRPIPRTITRGSEVDACPTAMICTSHGPSIIGNPI